MSQGRLVELCKYTNRGRGGQGGRVYRKTACQGRREALLLEMKEEEEGLVARCFRAERFIVSGEFAL